MLILVDYSRPTRVSTEKCSVLTIWNNAVISDKHWLNELKLGLSRIDQGEAGRRSEVTDFLKIRSRQYTLAQNKPLWAQEHDAEDLSVQWKNEKSIIQLSPALAVVTGKWFVLSRAHSPAAYVPLQCCTSSSKPDDSIKGRQHQMELVWCTLQRTPTSPQRIQTPSWFIPQFDFIVRLWIIQTRSIKSRDFLKWCE